MTSKSTRTEKNFADSVAELCQRASEELRYAYQRNKEAFRHHEAGAFKAALHHAKLSTHHASNAHAHLQNALHAAEMNQGAGPGC